MTSPTGGDAFLHDLESNLRAELPPAGTSEPEEDALAVPIDQWLAGPADIQRYEVGLGDLLGAVEAMEDDS
jgi:hypothetical protein